MAAKKRKTLGQVAFEAFGKTRFSNATAKQFRDCWNFNGDFKRKGWEAAARAVVREYKRREKKEKGR